MIPASCPGSVCQVKGPGTHCGQRIYPVCTIHWFGQLRGVMKMAPCNWLNCRGPMLGYYLSVMSTHNLSPQCCQLVKASSVYVRAMPQTQTLWIRPGKLKWILAACSNLKTNHVLRRDCSYISSHSLKISGLKNKNKLQKYLTATHLTTLVFNLLQLKIQFNAQYILYSRHADTQLSNYHWVKCFFFIPF